MARTYRGDELVAYLDDEGHHYLDDKGTWQVKELTSRELAIVAYETAQAAEVTRNSLHRNALEAAREILLDYGTPGGYSFLETLTAVQTAVVDYRDSGIKDPACEEHLLWISLRSNEITTLRSLKILP